MMYDYALIKRELEQILSHKRYEHCCNVAQSAYELALKYGESCEKAYACGLLHDICKEMPFKRQKQMALSSGYHLSFEELCSKSLWHAVAGAYYAAKKYNIDDEDMLNAIRYHTVARERMSRLEEIIYLADLISADRKYKDVGRIRKLAFSDLQLAMREALRFTLTNVSENCVYLPICSVQAYNQYVFMCSDRNRSEQEE